MMRMVQRKTGEILCPVGRLSHDELIGVIIARRPRVKAKDRIHLQVAGQGDQPLLDLHHVPFLQQPIAMVP